MLEALLECHYNHRDQPYTVSTRFKLVRSDIDGTEEESGRRTSHGNSPCSNEWLVGTSRIVLVQAFS